MQSSSAADCETNESFGANWPSAEHIKNWEQQWKTDRNSQKQMEKATTSSATEPKEESNAELEEGEITDHDQIVIENTGKEDEPKEENNDEALIELAKLEKLVHSRELLQKVICPLENVELFIKHFDDLSALQNCLVAFRFVKKNCEANLPPGVYIDQIHEAKKDTIAFKHYGSFKFSSIQPYSAEKIGDDDFEKWLDVLIHAGEELPEILEPLEKKNKLALFVGPSFFEHLCTELQNYIEGIIGRKQFPDISSIVLKNYNEFNKLLKFSQNDSSNILCGLCIQVDISQICHCMKLPPLMNLFKFMLIPISTVTFDGPKYEIQSMCSYFTNVLVHSKNGNGDVLCSSKLPQQKMVLPMSTEQLIQISLGIWAMNNIPMPTAEYIEHKAVELQKAFVLGDKILLPGTSNGKYRTMLPIGPPPLLQKKRNQKDEELSKGKWTFIRTYRKNGKHYKWTWTMPENSEKFKKPPTIPKVKSIKKMKGPARERAKNLRAKLLYAKKAAEARERDNRKTTKHSVRNQLSPVKSHHRR